MAEPTKRPPKPKLYKFVSVPRVTTTGGATIRAAGSTLTGGGAGPAAASMIKAMNSLGATVNSVAIITESIAKQTSRTIATEIRQQSELIKRQEKARKEKIKRDREKEERKRKAARKEKDADAEKKSEGLGKFFKTFSKMATAVTGSLLGGLVKIFEAIFRSFVVLSVLDWLGKAGNINKVETIIKGLIGVFKVFKRLIDFGVSSMLEGLVKIIDNPVSFKGLFGIVQFMIGSAVLFKTLSWIKNPAKLAEDLFSVMRFLAKGIINLKKGVGIYGKIKKFAGTRAGKYAMAGAVGVGAGMGSALLGGSKEEAIGTGIGAGAGALAGEMLGDRFGPAAGAAGAAAGSLIGGLLGGQVGKALKPVTDAIGKFFKLIGDILKPAFDFVSNVGKQFFQAVGDLIQAVVSFIEPHKETLGAIAKVSLIVAFGPLIALMKAITWVIRLFVPKSQDTQNGSQSSTKRSYGGKVVVPQMAGGGPLIGPNNNFIDPITQNLKKGLQDAMLLPFRAVGTGLVSAFGLMGSVFGAFLPGPMQAFLGGVLAPIASMFGVPNSVFKKVSSIAMQGIRGAAGAVSEGASGLLEKLMGGDDETSVTGILKKILGAMLKLHEQNNPTNKAIGGVVPQAARGGWINGPMSGYPVSLDGGRSTAFIGHGTEWVGFKNRAAGGGAGSAFVVPFHTPATVRTPSLTGMRMNQARAGGYAMPRSMGGLLKFATGGKFDPQVYNKSLSAMSSGIPVGKDNKKITMRYAVDGDSILLGHAIDQTNANWDFLDLLGNDGKVKTIDPAGNRFKEIVSSKNLLNYLASDANIQEKLGPKFGHQVASRGGGKRYYFSEAEKKNLAKAIKIHPDAKKFYDWTVRGKRLVGQGKKPEEAWQQAAAETGVVTAQERAADSTTPASTSSTETKDAGAALEEAFKKFREAFGGGDGDKIDKQSVATSSAQQEASRAKIKQEAAKVSEAANKLQTQTSVNPKMAYSTPVLINSGGSGSKPSADINPFLQSKFGMIAQTAFDPKLTLF